MVVVVFVVFVVVQLVYCELLTEFKLGWRHVVKPFAELASQGVGPTSLLRISVALGSRVEPVERKPSCKRVL